MQATELTTALGASAAFTGSWVDLGPGGGKITATARSDQSGTLTIQESPDGTATQEERIARLESSREAAS